MSTKWSIAQWLELRWWQRYLRGKDTARYLQWKSNYWHGVLAKTAVSLSSLKDKEILDAGCGPAGIYMILDQSRVTAVDPLLPQYEQKLAVFNSSMYPYVNFVRTPLEQFSSPTKFDVIFCMNAINHVNDIKEGLNILSKHLKADGTLIMTVDAHRSSFLKQLFRFIPGDALHPHQYDMQGYISLLSNAGLEVVKTARIKYGRIFTHELLAARLKTLS